MAHGALRLSRSVSNLAQRLYLVSFILIFIIIFFFGGGGGGGDHDAL